MCQSVDRSCQAHRGAASLEHKVAAIRLGAIFGFAEQQIHGILDYGFLIPDWPSVA
jgi:hypothetical protein